MENNSGPVHVETSWNKGIFCEYNSAFFLANRIFNVIIYKDNCH